MLKKVAVIGPESTGKSTLCARLAAHYGSTIVNEYAREYLFTIGPRYIFEDLLHIAKGQIKLEDEAIAGYENSKLLSADRERLFPIFIDTEMNVMKVWSEFVFGKCDRWILNQVAERNYDLFLLCNIDLPWVKDELREYPDLVYREKLYHHYKDIMYNQPVPWIDISGDFDTRLLVAIAGVDKIV